MGQYNKCCVPNPITRIGVYPLCVCGEVEGTRQCTFDFRIDPNPQCLGCKSVEISIKWLKKDGTFHGRTTHRVATPTPGNQPQQTFDAPPGAHTAHNICVRAVCPCHPCPWVCDACEEA